MPRTWVWTAVVLVVIAGGSYALYMFLQPEPLPEALRYGNGHIEGTEVHVAAEVPGRVVDSRLVEGESVDAGAPLVSLDRADFVLRRDRAYIGFSDTGRRPVRQIAPTTKFAAQRNLPSSRMCAISALSAVQRKWQKSC